MVLTDILNILKSDTELQSLLGGTTADKKIYAFSADKLNSIVYNFTLLTSNKIVGQAKLELTINTLQSDYNLNMQILDRVKQLLLTLGDSKLINNVIEVTQNGGGVLTNEETKTIHQKIILNLKFREEKITWKE